MTTSLGWRLLAIASVAAGVACGSTTVAPSRPGAGELALEAGIYQLSVVGYALSDDPLFPPCSPLFVPAAGTAVTTHLRLERKGSIWVARSAQASPGSIEFQFRDAGPQGSGRAVSGLIRGAAPDAPTPLSPARDVIVSFGEGAGDGAAVEGGTDTPVSTLLSGRVTGQIRFADVAGATSTCMAVRWILQPD
jgi:hypothetical protein